MMPNDISDDFKMGAKNFLTLFVLFNTFVPISLYVTIEFIKLLQVLTLFFIYLSLCLFISLSLYLFISLSLYLFISLSLYLFVTMTTLQSYFLANDLDLYDAETDQPVIVKTTSLLEDLGQVCDVLNQRRSLPVVDSFYSSLGCVERRWTTSSATRRAR
jgi:magnesium-transporting ATPase (P-type)